MDLDDLKFEPKVQFNNKTKIIDKITKPEIELKPLINTLLTKDEGLMIRRLTKKIKKV
jgi:hypothetical protein